MDFDSNSSASMAQHYQPAVSATAATDEFAVYQAPPVRADVSSDVFARNSQGNSMIVQGNDLFDSHKMVMSMPPSYSALEDQQLQSQLPRSPPLCDWNLPISSGPETTVFSGETLHQQMGAISSTNDPFFPPGAGDLPNESVSNSMSPIVNDDNDNQLYVDPSFDPISEFLSEQDDHAYSLPIDLDMEFGVGSVDVPVTNSRGSQTDPSRHGTDVLLLSSNSGATPSFLVTGQSDMSTANEQVPGRPTSLPHGYQTRFLGRADTGHSAMGRHHHGQLQLQTPQDELIMTSVQTFKNRPDTLHVEFPESSSMEGISTPPQTPVAPTQESSNSSSSGKSNTIADSLSIIQIMSQKVQKPTVVFPHGTVVNSYGPQPSPSPVPPSPTPSYHSYAPTPSPMPSTPASYSSAPSHLPPPPSPSPSPVTPCTPSIQNIFDTTSHIEGNERVIKLCVRSDVSNRGRMSGLRCLYRVDEMCSCMQTCLDQAAHCDLKVANENRAKFCKFSLDAKNYELEFRFPKECVPVQQWLQEREREGAVDFRHRLMVLQTVVNTVATFHTLGNEQQLCLYGAFNALVEPDSGSLYLLVDFPELLKAHRHSQMSLQNPRIADCQRVLAMCQEFVLPYCQHNNNWVSPYISRMLRTTEAILSGPNCHSLMAEVARVLGERRLCRVEVQLQYCLTPTVFCIEQEPISSVLECIRNILFGQCYWYALWVHGGSTHPVELSDMATADRKMELQLIPSSQMPPNGVLYLLSDK